MSRKKVIFIVVGIVVLLFLGLGGYNMIAKKTGAPQLPDIPSLLSGERSLQGVWTLKELYVADPATGELKLQTVEEGQKNSYLEFKGNMFCTSGQLDPERKPYPCSQYQPFSVSGDKITIEDPNQSMTASWKIISGNLELTLELPTGSRQGSVTQKVKFVLTEL